MISWLAMAGSAMIAQCVGAGKQERVRQVFSESCRMMEGHRIEFLKLILSFAGYACLGVLSFGLGFLWVYPYVRQSLAFYHLGLREAG